MKTEFIVTISVVLGVVSLLVLLRLFFSSTRKKLENHIQKNFSKNEIIGVTTNANFFGEQSKGAKQVRGNGALVLTKDRIYFIRAVPFKEYTIPLKSVSKVSLPNSSNGKSIFSKLLCIQYETGSELDAVAWAVKNPESWKKSIEKLVGVAC